MTVQLNRSWLVIAIGGKSIRQCARTVRRGLPAGQLGFIGICFKPCGTKSLVLKPLSKRPTKITGRDSLLDLYRDQVIEAAVSVRDKSALTYELGDCLTAVATDIVLLVDYNDPQCFPLYRNMVDLIARQKVLRSGHTLGTNLLVLISGSRHDTKPNFADLLREHEAIGNTTFDHVVVFQPYDVDQFTVDPSQLSYLAGRALNVILRLDADHPVRLMFRPFPPCVSRRMGYWSLGFSVMTGRGDEFLAHVRHCYLRLLEPAWRQRKLPQERVRSLAEDLVGRLTDCERPDSELSELLGKWAISFFGQPLGSASLSDRPTPADLLASLTEVVKTVAIRSQRISADLPNRPVKQPKPEDPRGWLRRVLNWVSRNRLFRWEWDRKTRPDIAAQTAVRVQRLAAFDLPIMNIQLAAQRALGTLRRVSSRPPAIMGRANSWSEAWMAPIIRKHHSKILRTLDWKALAKKVLDGDNPLAEFERMLLEQLGIPTESRGLELADAIDVVVGANGTWLRQAVRILVDQAAPWRGEPLAADSEEHTFALLPRDECSKAARVVDAGISATSWDEEAYGVLRLLRGCMPEMLVTAQDGTISSSNRSARRWIADLKAR